MVQTEIRDSIYGDNLEVMEALRQEIVTSIKTLGQSLEMESGLSPVDHCVSRIKSEESMREKCRRRGLPETAASALLTIHDAIGVRVVCAFPSDVYLVRDHLRDLPGFEIFEEKDYIREAKSNGYRSLHLILRTNDGRAPAGCALLTPGTPRAGGFFVEVQLRTISMESWAALEHQMKYKKEPSAKERLIVAELKRCADELASTDLSMQAIRDLILEDRNAAR